MTAVRREPSRDLMTLRDPMGRLLQESFVGPRRRERLAPSRLPALDIYDTDEEEENCIRRECCYGSFSGTAMLPDGVDADRTEASLEDGVLTLTIPKTSEAKPKVIRVNGDKK